MEYRTAVSEFQIAKCLSVAAGNESGTCCQKNVTMQNIIHIKEKKFGMVSKKRREMITLMLILPIKKKWFDMILSGEKKEEYREIKPYYTSRFKKLFMMCPNSGFTMPGCSRQEILFRNGYRKDSPSFVAECSLDMGEGKKEWGAEKGKEYYILKIEKIVKN